MTDMEVHWQAARQRYDAVFGTHETDSRPRPVKERLTTDTLPTREPTLRTQRENVNIGKSRESFMPTYHRHPADLSFKTLVAYFRGGMGSEPNVVFPMRTTGFTRMDKREEDDGETRA